MKNKILFLIAIAPAILLRCAPGPCADVLIKKDTTSEAERKNTLFAFVGEKIEVTAWPHDNGAFDNGFHARYKVIQRIYGCYPGDTIEFIAYDHYGWPPFSKYKNAILYVSAFEGEYYHEKYQYDDVYLTKSGKWAGPYDHYYANHYIELNIVPQRIEFKDTVSFPLKKAHEVENPAWIDYPHPFYWTVGNKAIAQYGIYVENLFKIKKNGVLTARGLFDEKNGETSNTGLIPQDVQLEEVPAPDPGTAKVSAFWKKFLTWIVQGDTTKIKSVVLDSLWVCGTLFSKQRLMSGCFGAIFDSSVVAQTIKGTYIDHTVIETNLKDILPGARRKIIKEKDGYRINQIELCRYDNMGGPAKNLFISFIKTKNGYRLYDIHYTRNRSCCF